jgi:hypothetical protein
VLGPYVLREANLDEDRTQATDMILLKANGLRVACRVRGCTGRSYEKKYAYDVTITCRRESGASCEWDKMIVGGMADWFFYGHALNGHDIAPWYIVDLAIARPWFLAFPGPEISNRDAPGRRCFFHVFDVNRMRVALGGKCLIGARWPAPTVALGSAR